MRPFCTAITRFFQGQKSCLPTLNPEQTVFRRCLYLAFCEAGFATSYLNVHHLQIARRAEKGT